MQPHRRLHLAWTSCCKMAHWQVDVSLVGTRPGVGPANCSRGLLARVGFGNEQNPPPPVLVGWHWKPGC